MADVLAITFPRPEVAVLTLNRPDRLNALTAELVAAITNSLNDLGARREVRLDRGTLRRRDLAERIALEPQP